MMYSPSTCWIAIETMVAFFLFPSALADQRQLFQAGFMAPYSSTYSAVASPQMYAPVAPEMVYASQMAVAPEMMYASPEQYAYPAAYPVYEQETSDWSNVAMLAVAGAVLGGVIGYKTKQGSTATQKRAVTARANLADEDKVAMLLFGGKGAAPKKKPEFAYGLPGNFNAVGGTPLNWDPAGFLEGKSELEVNRYREAELTHGRVGMLAALGFLVQEKFHPLFS